MTATVRVELLWGTAITLDVREPLDPTLSDAVFAWFHRVDDLFSTWRHDSEISRLANCQLGLHEVSAEVRTVLRLCDVVQEQSRGAFDIRVGADPRVAPRNGLGPIDPSGLVKGWALQRAAERLRSAGVMHFSIAAGGDVLAAGQPAPGRPWQVGIQHPWQRDAVAAVIAVSDVGVATSGRYEQGDHVIDPRTAAPATGLMSVTVVARDLALADAYATAALVLGHDAMGWLTDEMGVAALAIDDDRKVIVNRAFDELRGSTDSDAPGALLRT